MFITQQDYAPPGLAEARKVQAEIKRLGVQDVELFWDAEFQVWCMVQVRKANTGIVTMDNLDGSKAEPYLLYYLNDDKTGKYRAPDQRDVNNVIAIVRESQHWFEKGGDAFNKELDERDEKRREKKQARQLERAQPHLKALKKAIREELG